MSDKGSPKGFAGLSGMVSDGTVPAAETSASAKYQMISLTKNPSMAAPWSGDGPGEGWKWGDFYITVQTRPVTQSEFMAGKMGGKAEPWEGLEYLYSATVFRDPEKNEHGKSSRPVLVIAVEKSDFGTMVGVFDGDVRSNLGEYTGRLDVDSARATFFDFIGKRFAPEGQPERLGTIEAIRPKVVTRDVSKIPENAGNAQGAGGEHPGRSPMGLFAGKRSLVLAGFAALVAWGILARPDFLFGYESYEECVIARMKGQPANVLATVQKACRKANPAVVNNQKPSNPFDQFDPPREVPNPFAQFDLSSFVLPDKGFNFDAKGQPLINFNVDGALRNGHSKLAIAKYLCELRKLDFTELQSRDLSNDAIIVMLAYPSEPSIYDGLSPNAAKPEPTPKPSYNSEGFEGWTQESTGSTEVGPWLKYSPHGTRYCRYADRTIIRLYPPGVMPHAERASPFCFGTSTEYVPK